MYDMGHPVVLFHLSFLLLSVDVLFCTHLYQLALPLTTPLPVTAFPKIC